MTEWYCNKCDEIHYEGETCAADELELLTAEVIKHAARLSCHCQMNGLDCEAELHWPSCIVGKAKRVLGEKVTVVNLRNHRRIKHET